MKISNKPKHGSATRKFESQHSHRLKHAPTSENLKVLQNPKPKSLGEYCNNDNADSHFSRRPAAERESLTLNAYLYDTTHVCERLTLGHDAERKKAKAKALAEGLKRLEDAIRNWGASEKSSDNLGFVLKNGQRWTCIISREEIHFKPQR